VSTRTLIEYDDGMIFGNLVLIAIFISDFLVVSAKDLDINATEHQVHVIRTAIRSCDGPYNAKVCDSNVLDKLGLKNRVCLVNFMDKHASIFTKRPVPWVYIDNSLPFTGNNYLDLIIYSVFFQDMRTMSNGYFVDVGASNGISASNTIFFEYCLGWKGLLVEGSQQAQGECGLQLRKTRPRSSIELSAIGESGSIVDLTAIGQIFAPNCPISELNETELYELKHRPANPLDVIFEKRNITKIDFLSIDVEDQSLYALKSIDFSKVSISVICVEVRKYQTGFLRKFGYHAIQIGKKDTILWKDPIQF
jgi:hypothetical protein